MLKTLARNVAPEPESWIPIESLESLPELEDLLDPRYLVDSGQTRAVKVDKFGHGLVSVPNHLSHSDKGHRHRKLHSKKRTIMLKKRARAQKVSAVVLITIMAILAVSLFVSKSDHSVQLADSSGASTLIPTKVPVIIEGEKTEVFSLASNLSEFVKEQNLSELVAISKSFDRNLYESRRSTPSMEFRYNKNINLNVDGRASTYNGLDLTVGDILEKQNVTLDSNDIVQPAPTTKAYGVEQIIVTSVSTTSRVVDEVIPYKIEKIKDATLTKGKTKIQRKGLNGIQQVTYSQNVGSDGKVISEAKSGLKVTRNPVSQIVHIGTKPLQKQAGSATFYSAPAGTCAHKTLPKGTIVTVTNKATGKSTTCRVADRGPFAKGRIIDLSRDVFGKIASLSKGVISVTLSW